MGPLKYFEAVFSLLKGEACEVCFGRFKHLPFLRIQTATRRIFSTISVYNSKNYPENEDWLLKVEVLR